VPSTLVEASQLNLFATVLVAFFGLITLLRLDRRYRPTDEARFLYWSHGWWLAAWLCWTALWSLAAFPGQIIANPVGQQRSLLLLSDLNTAFIFVFYISLTRARDLTASGYVIVATMFAATFGLVDLLLLSFPGEVGGALQDRWSMALSMAAPILVGWGCRQRYGSPIVLVVAAVYAIGQPAAQLAVLGGTFPNGGAMSGQSAAIVLTLLAAMKVLLGAAVTFVAGYEPSTVSSIASRFAATTQSVKDDWWPAVPFSLAGVGVAGVLVISAIRNPEIFSGMGATITGAVVFLAAFIRVVEFVIDKIRKGSGSSLPPVQHVG